MDKFYTEEDRDQSAKSLEEYYTWFNNHDISIKENEGITIIKLKEKLNKQLEFVSMICGNRLFISGYLGHCVFVFKNNITLSSFDGMDIKFYVEHLKAFSDYVFVYNKDKAVEDIISWKNMILKYNEIDDIKEFDKNIKLLIDDARRCFCQEQWTELVKENHDVFLSKYDYDYSEWIFDIGGVISSKLIASLASLKLASKNIKIKY